MPVFSETLTVPRLTSLSSPVSQELITVPGFLTLLRIYTPPGPSGEVYLRLKHMGVQAAPARAGTWWRLDNKVLDWPLSVQVEKGDVIFYLEGASPNANYNHTFDFELTILTGTGQEAPSQMSNLLGRLSHLFGG